MSELAHEPSLKGRNVPARPRRIWLRSFYGFGPEEDGYIGWTEPDRRDRMLGLVEDGDMFMIYGASSAETARAERNRVIGFLQIEARPINDSDKASPAGMERKRQKGWSDRWTNAIPVVRAWRVDVPILLERIAPKTYRPEAGQAIAVWSPPLLPEEVEQALKIRVTEISVFGEPPLSGRSLVRASLAQAFTPSSAFLGSFGARTSFYEDGPTRMYMARFVGDGFALLGETPRYGDKSVLLKIGVSNDPRRRVQELNSGIPPAAIGRWKIPIVSEPYGDRAAAEVAEKAFKDIAAKELRSLGGEFFIGKWDAAEIVFARIPGVSRFGG